MHVYAENFRGFGQIDVDLSKITFLIGDNSSGKSSILYLIDCVSRTDLTIPPRLDEDFGVSEFDYFSPYFGYEEVVFSFYEASEKPFAKIISVKRNRNFPPSISACSYYYEGTLLTYRARGESQQKRIEHNVEFRGISDLVLRHKVATGFKRVAQIKGMSVGDPSMIFAHHGQEIKQFDGLPEKVFGTTVSHCRLISPIRALPEKFYQFKRKIAAHGTHFASMWMDLSKFETSEQFSNISEFGREADLFDKVSVSKVSKKIDDSPLLVTVSRNGMNFTLNQVGVGVSQIVPVLIESAYSLSLDKTVLLVQQPELHLHPIAQAALGSYFFKASSNGLRAVIETHSSYFIDRFRADLRDNIARNSSGISGEDTEILFCTNSEIGNRAQKIGVSDSGVLIGDPADFHEFFINETMRTMF